MTTEKLDLEEGKRLLGAMTTVQGVAEHHEEFDGWLWDNADSLIARAEDAEKLRELLREWAEADAAVAAARKAISEMPRGTVIGEEYWQPADRKAAVEQRMRDAALTPPEPQITVKEQ